MIGVILDLICLVVAIGLLIFTWASTAGAIDDDEELVGKLNSWEDESDKVNAWGNRYYKQKLASNIGGTILFVLLSIFLVGFVLFVGWWLIIDIVKMVNSIMVYLG